MNILKPIIGCIAIVILFTVNTQAQADKKAGTQSKDNFKWYSWNEGYELAKSSGKIVLVDMYTDWCVWCKRMDNDTYAKGEIIKMINKDFIAIKFNPEKTGITYNVEGNKVDGRQLAGMLANGQRVGYPSTFFIFPTTRKLYLVSGYQNAERFKSTLQTYINMKSAN